MINNVVLVGRLTKKPELKFTTTGTKYTQFSVVYKRNLKKSKMVNTNQISSIV